MFAHRRAAVNQELDRDHGARQAPPYFLDAGAGPASGGVYPRRVDRRHKAGGSPLPQNTYGTSNRPISRLGKARACNSATTWARKRALICTAITRTGRLSLATSRAKVRGVRCLEMSASHVISSG